MGNKIDELLRKVLGTSTTLYTLLTTTFVVDFPNHDWDGRKDDQKVKSFFGSVSGGSFVAEEDGSESVFLYLAQPQVTPCYIVRYLKINSEGAVAHVAWDEGDAKVPIVLTFLDKESDC
ncbi:MAG TPA: hypothetical protein VLA04_01635 [Verrucomicrobiae bacterium]|nr:hypothetical protein [Verrucomicrobiae bacterium]